MHAFTIERPVETPELLEALGGIQPLVDFEVPIIEPKIVLLTKRMSHRADRVNAQTPGVDTIQDGIEKFLNHKSHGVELSLGALSVRDGNGNPACLGFPVRNDRARKSDSLEPLLTERKQLAGYFGIKLHENEFERKDFYVTVFLAKGIVRSDKLKAKQAWDDIRANRSFVANVLGARLVPHET